MASERLRIWLEDKPHSVEGHIYEATLTFNDTIIWGPKTCHDNTVTLREKIHEADNRFDITFTKKDKTIEGHTKYIYVIYICMWSFSLSLLETMIVYSAPNNRWCSNKLFNLFGILCRVFAKRIVHSF